MAVLENFWVKVASISSGRAHCVWQTDIFTAGWRHSERSPPTYLAVLTVFSTFFRALCFFLTEFERI